MAVSARRIHRILKLTLLVSFFSCAVSTGSDEIITSIIKDMAEHILAAQDIMPSSARARPFVTASFAQSIDGKLAAFERDGTGTTTSNYPLSGKESLLLTHAIRSVHDGIVVGGRTLLIDNPQLNNRLWGDSKEKQPRPIVLDTHLRYVRELGDSKRVENLIACCSEEAAASFESLPPSVQIVACKCLADGRLDLNDVLSQLYTRFGIKSIMVEGGAAVLSSFFNEGLVDHICITIAPKLLGAGIALSYSNLGSNAVVLEPSRFVLLGSDCVLSSPWPSNT
jgi:diaminohydroxyphosphoribosylaminopyrimidine deaminase/5-amino-6-(5-phosphoribosylamino)uracil reductase